MMLTRTTQYVIHLFAVMALIISSLLDSGFDPELQEDSENATHNIQTSGSKDGWKASSWIGSYILFYWVFAWALGNWCYGGNKYWS
jgi:hypothetical protein